MIGPEGQVKTHTVGRRVVPFDGEIHADVIAAFLEVSAFRVKITENLRKAEEIRSKLPGLREKHKKMKQLLHEAIWEGVSSLAGKTGMRVVRSTVKKEGTFLVKVRGETGYEISGDVAESLFQQSEVLTKLEKEIAKTESDYSNTANLARGQASSGEAYRHQNAQRLLREHHSDVSDRFASAEVDESGRTVTFLVYEAIDEESDELPEEVIRDMIAKSITSGKPMSERWMKAIQKSMTGETLASMIYSAVLGLPQPAEETPAETSAETPKEDDAPPPKTPAETSAEETPVEAPTT